MISWKRCTEWWNEDVYRRWLLFGGFVFAFFFVQGIPLWDDDFTSWFWKIKDKSLFTLFLEIISPVSTQPQYWGFNERPIQAIIYKILHHVSGYESWSYFLYKSAVYAGLGVMVYLWGLCLVPKGKPGAWAALAAAVFFLLAPGPMASHVIHSDLATTAELIFLVLTYFIWWEIERTPESWMDFPSASKPEQKRWLIRWATLSFCTYIGYKSKADLKLIPAILALYVGVARPKQWKLFLFPVGSMALLAVPWGSGIFSRLPPFLPGSKGSEIEWMWQPASLDRLLDFFWSPGSYSILSALKSPTLSLAGLLGPFLLLALLAFLGWRMTAFDNVPWRRLSSPLDRARAFVLVWFVVIVVGVSALPSINSIFRIRYGILTLVPASLLLAWVFGLFADSWSKLPRWAAVAAVVALAIQSGINLSRSIHYRRDLGQVMVAVDQVYEHFAKKFPGEKLALFPDFRPYDYRPDAPSSIRERDWLSKAEDLVTRHQPYKAYVISWRPSLWEKVELVAHLPGCRETSLFDTIFPCPVGTGAYLMRYIGEDPLYRQAEALRAKGDAAGARKIHEAFLAKHPQSLAGMFVSGLLAFQGRDFNRAEGLYSQLERYLPDHGSILYNHALALGELGRHVEAIPRLKQLAQNEPRNYPVWINLYHAYSKSGQTWKATRTLTAMKRAFPNDGEVNRLLASGARG